MTNELYFTGGKNRLLKAIAKDSLPIIITGKPKSGRTTLAEEILTLSNREDVYDDCIDLNKMIGFALKTKQGIEFTIFVSEPEHVKKPIGEYYLVQCFETHGIFTFRVQAMSTNILYPNKTVVHITAEDKIISIQDKLSFKDIDLNIENSEHYTPDIIDVNDDRDVRILNGVLDMVNSIANNPEYVSTTIIPTNPKIVYVIDYSKDVSNTINRVALQKYIAISKSYNMGIVLLNAPEELHKSIKAIKKEGDN